jgi:Transposase family tnp2
MHQPCINDPSLTHTYLRSPRTLRAVMSVIADDLHVGETTGYPVVDCSRPLGDPDRLFNMKVVLLYVCADYPAQRLASGFAHSGCEACHYCKDYAPYCRGVSTVVHGDYYRWLPANDASRLARTDTPPLERNNEASCQDALQNEAIITDKLQTAAAKNQLTDTRRKTVGKTDINGINYWCPLVVLYLFDVVWDFVFDIMHAADVFKRIIVPTMKGERAPTRMTLATAGHEGAELNRRTRINRESESAFQEATQVCIMIDALLMHH